MKERRSATSREAISSPLKWHIDGGKSPLASRIAAMIPSDILHYVEPFAGGLSVLLALPYPASSKEGRSEVVNDLHGELMNFWYALQQPDLFARLQRMAEATAFSEPQYHAAVRILGEAPDDCALRAWAFFVQCRQSLAGRMQSFAPLSKTRTRRGMNEQASAWLSSVEGLPIVHNRLKGVVILNRDAMDVIRTEDGKDTFFYIDAPYLGSTRTATDVYTHEMSDAQHAALLKQLAGIQGRFLLSGYRSEMYDEAATRCGWTRQDISVSNNAARGRRKRRMTECLWQNY